MKYRELISYIKLLPRLPQTFGFGVHSPSAYYFIKYVINEKCPFYSYDLLNNTFIDLPINDIRLYQLYFRLVNYIQPHSWIDLTSHSNITSKFVTAGKKQINYQFISDVSEIHSFDIALVDEFDELQIKKLIGSAKKDSLLIIEHIYTSKEKKSFWKRIIQDNRVSVTFDLYECGLVFFDDRPKNHYKLLLR